KPAQDLVGRPPARGLHEAGDRALEAALARNLRLLLIGVITLHCLEVLAEKFVVIEVAFDEFPLIAARLLLSLSEIGAAHAKFGQHHLWRLSAVVFPMQLAAALDRAQPHLPRTVGEHNDMSAEFGRRIDRILAGGDGVDTSVEG